MEDAILLEVSPLWGPYFLWLPTVLLLFWGADLSPLFCHVFLGELAALGPPYGPLRGVHISQGFPF